MSAPRGGGKDRKITGRERFDRVAVFVLLQALAVVLVGIFMMRGDCHHQTGAQGVAQCA